MKITEGKYYRSNGGKVFGPMTWDEAVGVWRNGQNFIRNTGDYWHENGLRFAHIEHEDDLVEESPDPCLTRSET